MREEEGGHRCEMLTVCEDYALRENTCYWCVSNRVEHRALPFERNIEISGGCDILWITLLDKASVAIACLVSRAGSVFFPESDLASSSASPWVPWSSISLRTRWSFTTT